MESWLILQFTVNLLFLGAGVVFWVKLSRPPKDDPRLARGLQLLQSKITVLEDLSDRTDRQYQQMSQIIDQKTSALRDKIGAAQKQLEALELSMEKSLEVAEIFQDKIPHEEIVERQNTIKYVKAAQLAHQGKTVAEIKAEIDLPAEQLEFIVKVNREQLVFDESQLPDWLNRALNRSTRNNQKNEIEKVEADTSPFENDLPSVDDETQQSLKRLGDQFRQACIEFEDQQSSSAKAIEKVSSSIDQAARKIENQVRKVVFPSI